MKLLLALTLLTLSLSSMAAFNEIECRGKVEGKEFMLEIEEPFPRNSVTRNALLTITEDGAMTTHRYWITHIRSWSMNKIKYSGAGINFEFDHWPDSAPRWGRTYQNSSLRVKELGTREVRNVSCQFLKL